VRHAVVVVGGIEDNPGTSITNAIEVVAAAVRRTVLPEGRPFVLVEHYADQMRDRGRPAFAVVRFKRSERLPSRNIWAHLGRLHVAIASERPLLVAPAGLMMCGFTGPSWHPVEHVELQARLSCDVSVWPAGHYTASALAGSDGQRLIELIDSRGGRLHLPPSLAGT
jgi:hypothetical protein